MLTAKSELYPRFVNNRVFLAGWYDACVRLADRKESRMKTWRVVWLSLALLAVAANAYATPVPEIGASGAITGLSLLAGVVALVAERLRRK